MAFLDNMEVMHRFGGKIIYGQRLNNEITSS